jgi:hypothetical protein
MRKLSLAVVAAVVLIAAVFAPSLIARQQSATRFEYLRVAPYGGQVQEQGRVVLSTFLGLRACVATSTEWACRDFPQASSDAIRTVFATLGNEGWELVSAGYDPQGLAAGTYLFKRHVR